MPLRCLLFCSDGVASQPVIQVLAELQIDAEPCPDAITATERVTSQKFQIVILDWDNQPDAGLLLSAARTRKASERPLILALVGDDEGVPKALQAGANSIIRKPILVNHVRDTITTARDLLRAKVEQSVSTAKTFAARAASSLSTTENFRQGQAALRTGEFLQSSNSAPGAQFITEPEVHKRSEQTNNFSEFDPLKELEPTAGALNAKPEAEADPVPAANQPRGLAWYSRPKKYPSITGLAAAPALAPTPSPVPAKPELLSFDQSPLFMTEPVRLPTPPPTIERFLGEPVTQRKQNAQETESQLFAHIAGEHGERPQPETHQSAPTTSRARVAGIALLAVTILAGLAYWKLPQSWWKPRLQKFSASVMGAGHAWLNPQPVTPLQAAHTHENFAHAGDEYKLPVAEAIPDATTDASQIRVLPVVDPTAKQPKDTNANQAAGEEVSTEPKSADQGPVAAADNPSPTGSSNAANPVVPSPSVVNPVVVNPVGISPGVANAVPSNPTASTVQTPPSSAPTQTNSAAAVKPYVATPVTPAPQRNPASPFTAVGAGIPSSLKSQMASTTPEASGNKPAEAAMPAIEPVTLPETAARNLLLQQPAPAYPESAKGQSGTVVLQVLIGRDGTVQDAKFIQGSLVFARSAIEAVKQWHFQPYTMNGHPVSMVTSLTVSFKPAT
jgi:TonB family protein